jgi:UDP-N-acetylglucosamine acyltransferase
MLEPFISPLALIGAPPEHRGYRSTDTIYSPVIGTGCRINAFVTIDCGIKGPTTLGDNVLCLTKAHVGHDAVVGDGCEIATGAIIGGWCELGENVKVGLNAVIRPRVKVGAGARIGAGAVVVKDVPAGEVWVGNPAHPIERIETVDPLWEELYGARA